VREQLQYASSSGASAVETTIRGNPPPVVSAAAMAPEPLRVRAPDLHAAALNVQPTQAQAQTFGQPPMPVLVPEPAHASATAPIPKADLVSAAQEPISAMMAAPMSHANDVVIDFPDAAPHAKKRADRGARAVDEAYSQWLDDGSADARDATQRAPVPEQVVRGALRHAAEIAGDRSADVRQARADWEAAGFDTDAAKGARWPQLQIGGYSPSIRDSKTQFNDYNRAYANVNLSTTVYDWGKNSKTIESRSKTAAAAEFKYVATAQQNAFDVSSNLVELAKNRASFEIGVTYVKRMGALVDILAEIVKVDPGRSSELTQAKARFLQAQTSQDQVTTRMRELELAVKKLVGDEPVSMPRSTRWQMHVMSVDDAVAAIDQNPAVAQAAAEQEAADAYAKAVRASGLPQVNWVVTKSTGRDEFGQRQPWTTMLQLSWTPFSGGTQTSNERAARARATSSGEKKDQLRLDAEYNVRQAHHDALALSDRARLYDEVTAESELVRKQFFEQWYHLNRRTLLDVLLAESDFYNNRVAEVTTQFDAYQAVLKMRLNSGTLLQWLQQG
jgi:adhesin transport system outer membrane protein